MTDVLIDPPTSTPVAPTDEKTHDEPAKDSKPPTTAVDIESEKPTGQSRDTRQPDKKQTYEAFGERHEWGRPIDSVFAMVSFAVATSNVSRFISSYYGNGGMAFLIPYLLFTTLCAFPLLYLECIIGQFFREGFISIWKIIPVLKGIGYSIGLLLFVTCSFYMTPIAWCLVYLYYCFTIPLPWSTCNNEWNTPSCIEMIPENFYDANKEKKTVQIHAHSAGSEYFRGRILQIYKSFYADPPESSLNNRHILNNQTEIDRFGFDTHLNIGDLRAELALTLAGVYLVAYLFLLLDIKWTGWLSRVTASLPFAVLSILFFRGVVLEGAVEGLTLFFTFEAKALLKPKTWLAAASETFYSLGSGFGTHLVIASHNHFHHNIFRDCIITVTINLAISLFGAWTMSEYLGHWANLKNSNLTYLVHMGDIPPANELVFVVFPDAVSRLAGGAIFIFIFLLMVVLIIFDTVLIAMKSMVVSLADEFRHWFKTPAVGVKVFTFAIVWFLFVVNLLSTTRGGLWVYEFMEHYAVGQAILFVIFVQIFAVSWIWGMPELCEITEAIFKKKPGIFVRVCWKILVPGFILTLFILGTLQLSRTKTDRKSLPKVLVILGNVLQYLPILPIPIYAFTQCCQRPDGQSRKDRFRVLFTPQYVYHINPQVDEMTGKTLTLKHFFSFGTFKFEKVSIFNRNTARVAPEGIAGPPPPTSPLNTASQRRQMATTNNDPNAPNNIPPVSGPPPAPPTLEESSSPPPPANLLMIPDSHTDPEDSLPTPSLQKPRKIKKAASEMVQSSKEMKKRSKKKTSGSKKANLSRRNSN